MDTCTADITKIRRYYKKVIIQKYSEITILVNTCSLCLQEVSESNKMLFYSTQAKNL